MANYYVSSVAYTAITQWAAGTVYSLGQYRRQLAAPGAGNERVFKVTTAGTSGGSEPVWNKNDNATTADNTVVWTQIAGHEAEQLAGNWRAAAARLSALPIIGLTAADSVFLSNDHDEQFTADPGYNFAARVISASRVGATLPPTSTDLSPGAIIEWTGAAGTLTCGFQAYVYGVSFIVDGTSNSASLTMRSRGGDTLLDQCKFTLKGTNVASRINLGIDETNGPFRLRFKKPVFKFGNTSQQIVLSGNDNIFFVGDGSTIIDAGGSMPDRLFGSGTTHSNALEISKVDLSNFSGTSLFLNGSLNWNLRGIDFVDCIMPAGFTALPNTQALSGGTYVRFWNSDDGNRTYRFYEQVRGGIMQSIDNGARVGGASDGTNSLAWKFAPLTNSWWAPYVSQPIAIRNTSTGSSKTATLHLCSSVALTDADTWLNVSTLDDSGDTLGASHSTKSADILVAGAGLTTTTEDWTANASARQNSHAYVVGDTYKAASNPARLFICTGAGTSSGSEPGAVATAVDGTAFADGGATFVAGRRYKLSITWTPQRAGVIRGVFASALQTATAQIYVDPLLVIV